MDLLKSLLVYMAMVYATSVQAMPDAAQFMAAVVTPAPTVEVVETLAPVVTQAQEPDITPEPTPVPTIDITPNPEYRIIETGDRGERVTELQTKLAEYGYYTGEIDGRFGNQTRHAVQAFQTNHGLTADGVAGKVTLTVLYESNEVRMAPPPPTEVPTPTPSALQIAITPAGETPAPTFAPMTTADMLVEGQSEEPMVTPEPTPEPQFLPLDGWVIQLRGQEAPLTYGAESAPVQPYTFGVDVYVPLFTLLEANGMVVIPSDSMEMTEYAFALGRDLYRITYSEERDGSLSELNLYKNTQPQLAPFRDVRMGGEMVYLPGETVSGLTGINFELDEAAKVLWVIFPAE